MADYRKCEAHGEIHPKDDECSKCVIQQERLLPVEERLRLLRVRMEYAARQPYVFGDTPAQLLKRFDELFSPEEPT